MKLSDILTSIKSEFELVFINTNIDEIEIDDIAIDSRIVKKNDAFFSLKSYAKNNATNNEIKAENNLKFIADSIKKNASLLVLAAENKQKISSIIDDSQHKIGIIFCDNINQILAEFLSILFPAKPANIYAITGTNGKTSIAEFIRQIINFLDKNSASIGTLGIKSNIENLARNYAMGNANLTTPDIVSLHKNLASLKEKNINDVSIEASSIGLEQDRILGVNLSVAAFSNFSQDHLDYHSDMKSYFSSKMLLFSKFIKSGFAVLNADIEEFSEIKKYCSHLEIIDYGKKAEVLKIEKIATKFRDEKFIQTIWLTYQNKTHQFDISLFGEFQAMNVVCALGCVLAKNILSENDLEKLLKNLINLTSAEGRMSLVGSKNKADIFIDFAHTPDALQNTLLLAQKIKKNPSSRLIILFGCGGDRDNKKRSIMGKIASDLADFVIITDDNPRSENAALIRAEIISSCDKTKTIEIADRKIAIAKAIEMLKENDILILAGKGHEKYQIIGDKKIEFDEEKIVKNIIHELAESS